MRMIVGLGNYGAEYNNTPHNVGFMVMDKIASDLGVVFKKKRKNALIIETEFEGNKILLVKTQAKIICQEYLLEEIIMADKIGEN